MLRVLPMLAYLALVVYAIADVVQSDDDDTGGLPKALWILVILFLPLAGSIAWILVSRRNRQRRSAAPRAGFPAGPVPPARYPARRRTWESSPTPPTPSGDPDDDPEMRWLLEQARLQRERDAAAAGETPGASEQPADGGDRQGLADRADDKDAPS
ncbi:PLD nuclease N-terminal domain-containing protein [Isoptericola sp. BMS4]|uniref:PLD nuclease N-terminal domain-containing protein n=1 Tax=Isoptericola sp. BMS4 TaxID=2527875 RepID=UPI001F10E0C6|nr:PLD nuclease N-terminal domain-containing protein [Isoptericola sp. BMS4]